MNEPWKYWVLVTLLVANLAATVGASWSRRFISVDAVIGTQVDAVGKRDVQIAILQAQLQQAQQALEAARAAGKKP